MDIDWRTTKGFLTDNERLYLHDQAAKVPDSGLIVNIGVEYGASMACLQAGIANNRTVNLVGIDTDLSTLPDNVRAWLESRTWTWLEQGPSEIALKAWRSTWEQMNMVFVDGDHHTDAVRIDCSYADLIVPGGLILFHDCLCDNGKGECDWVQAAVEEWFQAHKDSWDELVPVSSMRIFQRRA